MTNYGLSCELGCLGSSDKKVHNLVNYNLVGELCRITQEKWQKISVVFNLTLFFSWLSLLDIIEDYLANTITVRIDLSKFWGEGSRFACKIVNR